MNYQYQVTIMSKQYIMQQNQSKIIAVFINRNNIGLGLLNLDTVRIQCSSVNSFCHLALPAIKSIILQCQTIISNNFSHQLFSQIDLEKFSTQTVNEKSLDYDIIEHNLMQISAHLTQHSNIKEYFLKFAGNRIKFNALGMLLGHALNQLGNRSLKIYLEDIQYFVDTLLQSVIYSQKELEFLQISKEDLHPSLIKGKGNSKEGYSVISAYEAFLSSTGSKRILRHIILNPTYNKQILEYRYQHVGWMKEHLKDGKYAKYFKSVHVLEAILKKFGRMNVEEEQWRKLLKTMEAMLQIRKLLVIQDAPHLVHEYISNQNWQQITQLFNLFKSTIELDPISIKNGIDGTLDQLKKTYDNMPHLLTIIAKEQEWPMDFRIVFMAQVGYLIKISHQTQIAKELEQEEWTLEFSNNSGKFFSNSLTQALDNQYGDLYGEIQDIEKKIIFDMQALIVERQQMLLELYWKLCEIECYWGIGQLSRNMCQPRLSSEGLIIYNGWHLLLTGDVIHNHAFSFGQKQAPKQLVYNSQSNLVNTNYSNRCMAITGPNASGKTVYMKQLGIILYLAHCGFFVPASLAEIPLVDSIVFVGKTESIYNNQRCGFQSELASLSSIGMPSTQSLSRHHQQQISYFNGLVGLINRLSQLPQGKTKVIQLLYTTIDYLTNPLAPFLNNRILTLKNDEFKTPLVLIVTHLSQILRSNTLEQNYLIRFLTMSVEEAGLRLFKIKPGLVRKGYGIKAAAQILPKSIIEASQRYLKVISKI